MNANVETIKQLRSQTGAGVMECRKALEQGDWQYPAALDFLRQQMELKAQKQAGREARQGRLELYDHNHGRIGVMVEINSETEFAGRSEVVRRFAHEIALQIAAAAPLYVSDEEIPAGVLDELAQAAAEKGRLAGKPEQVVAQIVAGALEDYKNTHVLLRQPYLRDESMRVAQLLSQASGQVGEKIAVRRFVRWEVGPEEE